MRRTVRPPLRGLAADDEGLEAERWRGGRDASSCSRRSRLQIGQFCAKRLWRQKVGTLP